MSECLRSLGIAVNQVGAREEGSHAAQVVEVLGGSQLLRPPDHDLFVGNSGTTVRFLAALAALVPGTVKFIGDEAMAKRPIADLIGGLGQLGVAIDCPTGCPPLTVHGGGFSAAGGTRRVTMRGDHSSQYFTALLLVAGMFPFDTEIVVEGELVSRPYVNMTISLVMAFGGMIRETANGFKVYGNRSYGAAGIPSVYSIEPDASSASYAFAAAVASGSRIAVPNLGPHSLQGDYQFVEILREMGAKVDREETPGVAGVGESTMVSIAAGKPLRGIDVDMHHISDTVMTLAALAPLCDGPTTIRNVANIRIKETDRLAATVNELRRLGQQVEHGDDWLRITPRPIIPATVQCYHDHRMAMSFAILGLAREGVTIADPACTSKTYPGFWDDLAKLYPQAPW